MQPADCGCAFLALRTLARIEELTTSLQVPLETALEVTSAADRPSLAVLNCEKCRQQRLPLTTVTILCAHLVDWLCRLWNLNEDVTKTSADTNSTTTATTTASNTNNTTESQNPAQSPTQNGNVAQPWKFSLGSYHLAADEADALSNELMTLRLTSFSAVLGSLEAALVTSGSSPSLSSSPGGRTNGTTSDTAAFAPACLDLVRQNLRIVRAGIRRLKARSLLNSEGASTLF